MNVIDLLSKELENKDWTLEQKARYLYIRSCELFSYDNRYNFCDTQTREHIRLMYEIRDRLIDLENVTDTRVICTSHAREIVSKLFCEILNIDCRNAGYGHNWVRFNDGVRDLNADATISSDLVRVKMGLITKGYKPDFKDYSFESKLKIIDKQIGYINDEYKDYYLQKRILELLDEFNVYSYPDNYGENSDEYLIYKILTIKELFEKYSFKHFSDSEFCISYLIKKIIEDDKRMMRIVCLYDDSNKENWDFINIYPFELKNEMIYYILKYVDNEFCFYETTKSEVIQYVKSLDGTNKNIILR